MPNWDNLMTNTFRLNKSETDQIFIQTRTFLLKDVRPRFDIWQYLRQGWLGKWRPEFQRLFYMRYDFRNLGFETPDLFAYRLASLLEEIEPEYIGRLNSVNLITNPLVNTLENTELYNITSGKALSYGTQNAVNDALNRRQDNLLGVNGTTQEKTKQGAITTAEGEKAETDANSETIADTSETHHVLNRQSDSPQNNTLGQETIGFTGTAGATGTKSKHDHYPKADLLVAAPWNSGYLTRKALSDQADDTHATTGNASITQSQSERRGSQMDASKEGTLETGITRHNQQGIERNKSQSYSDDNRVSSQLTDRTDKQTRQGLIGRDIGDVWVSWQDMQEAKNVMRDLLNDCGRLFLLQL